MVVVGSHHGGVVAEIVFGSVASSVVEHATGPVAVVPVGGRPRRLPSMGGWLRGGLALLLLAAALTGCRSGAEPGDGQPRTTGDAWPRCWPVSTDPDAAGSGSASPTPSSCPRGWPSATTARRTSPATTGSPVTVTGSARWSRWTVAPATCWPTATSSAAPAPRSSAATAAGSRSAPRAVAGGCRPAVAARPGPARHG